MSDLFDKDKPLVNDKSLSTSDLRRNLDNYILDNYTQSESLDNILEVEWNEIENPYESRKVEKLERCRIIEFPHSDND